MTIDADGCPHAYGPEGTKPLDYLANAGYPGNWWGIVTDAEGIPYVQRTDDGKDRAPWPGYYLSTTAYLVSGFDKYDARRYDIPATALYPYRHPCVARKGCLRHRSRSPTNFPDTPRSPNSPAASSPQVRTHVGTHPRQSSSPRPNARFHPRPDRPAPHQFSTAPYSRLAILPPYNLKNRRYPVAQVRKRRHRQYQYPTPLTQPSNIKRPARHPNQHNHNRHLNNLRHKPTHRLTRLLQRLIQHIHILVQLHRKLGHILLRLQQPLQTLLNRIALTNHPFLIVQMHPLPL